MEKWFDLYRGIVMPAQCDIYGHMNVRYYSAVFDDAAWHIPSFAGLSLAEIRSRGLGTVVATLSIDFQHEIGAGELILVRDAEGGRGVLRYESAQRRRAARRRAQQASRHLQRLGRL